MLKVFRITRDFHGVYLQGHKLKLWKVLEATVQSTAVYSAAAVSLVITFVNSTDVGYPTCLNVFPALIVRPLSHSESPFPFHQSFGFRFGFGFGFGFRFVVRAPCAIGPGTCD